MSTSSSKVSLNDLDEMISEMEEVAKSATKYLLSITSPSDVPVQSRTQFALLLDAILGLARCKGVVVSSAKINTLLLDDGIVTRLSDLFDRVTEAWKMGGQDTNNDK